MPYVVVLGPFIHAPLADPPMLSPPPDEGGTSSITPHAPFIVNPPLTVRQIGAMWKTAPENPNQGKETKPRKPKAPKEKVVKEKKTPKSKKEKENVQQSSSDGEEELLEEGSSEL